MGNYPVTPAIRQLRKAKVEFSPHLYDYEERGGTAVAAAALGVPETQMVKTLVMADDRGQPLIVLMDGPHEVSTKNLARWIGVKSVAPCKPEVAQKITGYQVGGTSPFGTRKKVPVYLEKRILELEEIYINGGKRGFLVAMAPGTLVRILVPHIVEASQ